MIKSVLRWLDVRLDLRTVYRALLDRAIPDRLTWAHTLGSALLTTFIVQAVTGVVLATYYSPSPDHAYDSVWFIQNQVLGGRLLRGMHSWAASIMVILIVAHMTRVFVWGAYKYPREVNWWIGVGLFVVVLGFSFTGYLLPWDQKAYWATQVGIGISGTTPVVGGAVSSVLQGGAILGAATLTRFFAFHTLWLPGLLGILVLVHIVIVMRQGIAPDPASLEGQAPERTDDPEYPAYYARAYDASKSGYKRFWPDIVAKDVVVSASLVVLIVILAAAFGARLELPADPSDTQYVPRPEWYFLPLYQLLTLVPGAWESIIAVGVPTILIVGLLALPIIDRRSARRITRRPLVAGLASFLLLGSAYLIVTSERANTVEAIEQTERPLPAAARAGRAIYLATGCADCHAVFGEGGSLGPDLSDVGLRRSPAWMHSFIEQPGAFLEGGSMPAFAPPQLSHQDVEELSRYLATLRAGLGPEAEPQFSDTFPSRSP